MKRALILFTVGTVSFLTACQSSESSKSYPSADSSMLKADSSKLVSQTKYTCTMHPEIISDTSGHCPKCGMDLVPIKDSTRK